MKYFTIALLIFSGLVNAQSKWQQKADYNMDIRLKPETNQYEGKMMITYNNYSPDTLNKIYFHLYYNAFQPNSLMDNRLKSIKDPDRRMVKNIGTKEYPQFVSKISELKPDEIGFQKIKSIQQNGKDLKFKVYGTTLEVDLKTPIKPNSKVRFDMVWEAQIPKIIRRGGRNSKENVAYSMTQWYPKVAMYDKYGWNLSEYIGREFYAPFADFDVKITAPSNYVLGASGSLVNEKEALAKTNKKTKTWHYKINNIHDFAWVADPDFKIEKQQVPNGPLVYYVYKNDLGNEYAQNWQEAQKYIPAFFEFMSERFGKYPWNTYTIMQGGDGGMEYGAATLITGQRSLKSLVGVVFHEGAHSWFQHLFGIDETQEEWFDEGFTSYAEAKAMAKIFEQKDPDGIDVHKDAYDGYTQYVKSGIQEPMSLLADYFDYNYAYSISSYNKGQVFPAQLGYIIGENNLKKTFKTFYNRWKLDHPSYKDFIKTAEDVSGINLKWYGNLFVNTTRFVDYGITTNGKEVTVFNKSNFAMPLDILVTYTDGSKELFYIPINAMRGAKEFEQKYYPNTKFTQLKDWGWAQPEYTFKVSKAIKSVQIDPTNRLADVNKEDNIFTIN